jgi:hypothetical protein
LNRFHRRHARLDVHHKGLMHQQSRHSARRIGAFLQNAARVDEPTNEFAGLFITDSGLLPFCRGITLP